MRPVIFLLIWTLICCVGCSTPKKGRKLPVYKRSAPTTESVLTVTTPADDLKGVQKYIGDGNTVTATKSMHFDFGKTQVDLPAGANCTFSNVEDSVQLTFNPPMPTVTAKVGPLTIHPFLQKILLRPDGTADALVKELGQNVMKKAVVRWTTEEPADDLEFGKKFGAEVEEDHPEFAMVPFSNTVWMNNGQYPDVEHLVSHGCPRWVAELYKGSPVLMGRIHGGYHENSPLLKVTHPKAKTAASTAAPVQACPGGYCPPPRKGRR